MLWCCKHQEFGQNRLPVIRGREFEKKSANLLPVDCSSGDRGLKNLLTILSVPVEYCVSHRRFGNPDFCIILRLRAKGNNEKKLDFRGLGT